MLVITHSFTAIGNDEYGNNSAETDKFIKMRSVQWIVRKFMGPQFPDIYKNVWRICRPFPLHYEVVHSMVDCLDIPSNNPN